MDGVKPKTCSLSNATPERVKHQTQHTSANMALPADITVNPTNFGGANVSTVYVFVTEKDKKSIRQVTATALTTPNILTIQHTLRKQGGKDVNSHQVRIDFTANDALAGPVSASVWTVFNLPVGQTAITAQHIKDMVGQIGHLVTQAGFMDKLLAGES